jgi:hypothetical protein
MPYELQDLLGESTRGMQDASLIGAIHRVAPGIAPQHARGVARLVARGVNKQSSQIGFIAVKQITNAASVAAAINTQGFAVSAVTRVQRPFKPCKFFVQEFISVTDSSSPPKVLAASSSTAIDIFLAGSFMGGDNTFPNAPTTSIADGGTAVNCSIFNANNLGSGISWAEVPGGIDMTLNFIAAQSLLTLGPLGTQTLTFPATYTLTISAQLMGPMAPT